MALPLVHTLESLRPISPRLSRILAFSFSGNGFSWGIICWKPWVQSAGDRTWGDRGFPHLYIYKNYIYMYAYVYRIIHTFINEFVYLLMNLYLFMNESICLSTCLFTQGHENREIFCFLVSPFPIQGPVASGRVSSPVRGPLPFRCWKYPPTLSCRIANFAMFLRFLYWLLIIHDYTWLCLYLIIMFLRGFILTLWLADHGGSMRIISRQLIWKSRGCQWFWSPMKPYWDNPIGGHAEQKLLPEHLGNFNDLYANAFKPQCRKTIIDHWDWALTSVVPYCASMHMYISICSETCLQAL